MSAKLKVLRILANLRRSPEWGRETQPVEGISTEWGRPAPSSLNVQTSSRPEAACGQAGQGRREADKGSAHQCVTRRRPTEDAEMRRATRSLSAAGVVAVVAGTLLLATPALALSGHTFSTSLGASGPVPLTNPTAVAVDQSSGDVYVANAPQNARQTVTVSGATAGTFTLTLRGQTTEPIAFDAPDQGQGRATVQSALAALSTVGGGNVWVNSPTHSGHEVYVVTFTGALASTPVEQMTADASGLTGGTATVTTDVPGAAGADVEKFTPAGEFILIFGREVNRTALQAHAPEAQQDLCTAASGDTCRPGATGVQPGQFIAPAFLAIDNSGGLSAGDVYVANVTTVRESRYDVIAHYVSKFDSSGNLISTWARGGSSFLPGPGDEAPAGGTASAELPAGLAVDRAGNLFAFNKATFESAESPDYLDQFGQFGSLIAASPLSPPLGTNAGLALDSSGNLLRSFLGASVHEMSPGGADLGSLTGPGFTGPPTAIATDLAGKEAYVADAGTAIRHYGPECQPSLGACAPTDSFGGPELGHAVSLAVDESSGVLYAADSERRRVDVFAPVPLLLLPDLSLTAPTAPTATSLTLTGHLDPAGAPEITACHFQYVTDAAFRVTRFSDLSSGGSPPCAEGQSFSAPADVHADLSALATETTYHYRLVLTNANGTVTSPAATFTPHRVIGLTTEAPTHLSGEAATLNGSLLGDGTETHYFFEWGTTESYGHKAPEPPALAASPAGPTPTTLEAEIKGLAPNTAYHYRIVAENGAHETSLGEDQEFTTPPDAPQISATSAAEVSAETAQLHALLNPGGGDTVYHAEYGTAPCTAEPDPCTATPALAGHAGAGTSPVKASVPLAGLTPGTVYHYRILAQNVTATSKGPELTFTTLPFLALQNDPCSNAHVRQQTSAASLLDCRAYELVSAANSGGYDVESNLIAGQSPFGGYPEAPGRVLYGVHGGGIPGTDHPTNRGVDPYLATRTEGGWKTEYVGIPSNATPSTAPFASPLLGADAGLTTFAFGGSEICQPCFADGSTGTPLHLPNGNLIQGMAGSLDPGPSAEPAGYVAQPLSADGSHFVFGSTSLFAPGGNEGEISIYDRNLKTGETHVVSKQPGNEDPPFFNLPCLHNCETDGIAELAISKDGSHVLIGQLISQVDGAKYWHLYMNVGDSLRTIDLTPTATKGVFFDGISADGSKVFFSSEEHLTGVDTSHTGADIYMWEEATNSLTLISKGNGNACHPAENSAHEHWNVAGSIETEANCGAVAIGGGGGVSSANGTIYFLSPELLDGSNGTLNAPNLYRAGPGDGYATHYVTTLESELTGPQPPKLTHTFKEDFGSFTRATGLAVDHSSGDLYVLDSETNTVEKFDSAGNSVDFTAGTGHTTGTNRLSGAETKAGSFSETAFGEVSPTALAVDPSSGDFYVPDIADGVVDKFKPSGELEKAFGEEGQVNVEHPSGVAVDPANGDLYVGDVLREVKVFDSSGKPAGQFETEHYLSGIAVDSSGTVYVSRLFPLVGQKGTEVYKPSSTSPLEYANPPKQLDPNPSQSVGVDPSTGNVYVDEGEGIAFYDSSGNRLETLRKPSPGHLSGSLGLAVDPEGNLYATDEAGKKVALFKPSLAPSPLVDNPAVLDSVTEPQARHSADFQLTPNGEFAAFPSTLPLAGEGEEPAGHADLFRYDAPAAQIACASCSPNGQPATADSQLAEDGLSLTDKGQLFFTTAAQLSAADTDNKKDVYEWEPEGTGNCQSSSPSFASATGACLALISAGTSTFDSGLLSATADGTDAYFFTRDSLAPQDQNGPTMKIYDAREGGGFPFAPSPVPCKASDECHGASSPSPPPIETGSEAGSPGNAEQEPKGCKKRFVKKHGRCVQRHPHKHRHHKRAAHKRGGKK